jgi:hypothetical protein
MTDWAVEVERMADAKRLLRRCDVENLWRHEPPGPPAPPELVERARQTTASGIDGEYASFLLHADGWPAIMQDVDLFGTTELLGSPLQEAQELLDTVEPEVLAALNASPDSLLPVGASRTDIDIFAMPRTNREESAPVIWIAGLQVERYPSFTSFFRGMIEHNIKEADELRSQN